jgi:hypothetical protein
VRRLSSEQRRGSIADALSQAAAAMAERGSAASTPVSSPPASLPQSPGSAAPSSLGPRWPWQGSAARSLCFSPEPLSSSERRTLPPRVVSEEDAPSEGDESEGGRDAAEGTGEGVGMAGGQAGVVK